MLAECYEPNTSSRLLDPTGSVARRVNNFAWISFDVGPTLLRWLEAEAPRVYQRILAGDRQSRERWGGGNAMAQAYSHAILPLASPRDRTTEIAWGIRDFESRFGRRPLGMWLPETAADSPTLEALAEQGIRFTILAPHQAAIESVDTGQCHEWHGAGGASLSLFFYDGSLAAEVAFGDALDDGIRMAERIAARGSGGLTHLATDGETFGHHHEFGEMALSAALRHLGADPSVTLTNYETYLAGVDERRMMGIVEESSWSCAHGIERWRSNCGCSTGGEPGWQQGWRGPLRQSLEWLRDRFDPLWEEATGELVPDPWLARDEALDLLDGDAAAQIAFCRRHAIGLPDSSEAEKVRTLLELQRTRLAMFASCAWFFNDIAGVETVQCLRYAAWLLETARAMWGVDLEPDFVEHLAAARGNRPELPTGAEVWTRKVQPSRSRRSTPG